MKELEKCRRANELRLYKEQCHADKGSILNKAVGVVFVSTFV